jgi:DNA invertase Pin-like site-specific DNA recombinase
MPRLGPATRNNVIDRLQAGQSQTEVARQFNVQQSTIYRHWLKIDLEVVGHASLVQPLIGISGVPST